MSCPSLRERAEVPHPPGREGYARAAVAQPRPALHSAPPEPPAPPSYRYFSRDTSLPSMSRA